jgi:hypothetical protein
MDETNKSKDMSYEELYAEIPDEFKIIRATVRGQAKLLWSVTARYHEDSEKPVLSFEDRRSLVNSLFMIRICGEELTRICDLYLPDPKRNEVVASIMMAARDASDAVDVAQRLEKAAKKYIAAKKGFFAEPGNVIHTDALAEHSPVPLRNDGWNDSIHAQTLFELLMKSVVEFHNIKTPHVRSEEVTREQKLRDDFLGRSSPLTEEEALDSCRSDMKFSLNAIMDFMQRYEQLLNKDPVIKIIFGYVQGARKADFKVDVIAQELKRSAYECWGWSDEYLKSGQTTLPRVQSPRVV